MNFAIYVPGTFETCRMTLGMSANRGRPEVIGRPSKRREWPAFDGAWRNDPPDATRRRRRSDRM